MRCVAKCLLVALLCVPGIGFAQDYLCSYKARISEHDKYNSSGDTLRKNGADVAIVAAILRQDRANYHVFNRRDPEDQSDCAFDDRKNREVFESFIREGSISSSASYQIINENPLISVDVYKGYVNVKIVDEPVRKRSTVQ